MGLETGTYLNDLVTTNPDGATDAKSEGDNHLRLIKSTLKATFPGMAGAAWRVQTKAADYTLAATDNMSQINVTAAATITGVAATLGNQFVVLIYNTHSAAITIPGSYTLPVGSAVLMTCNGSAFHHFPFAIGNLTVTSLTTTAGIVKGTKNSQTGYATAGVISESATGDALLGMHCSGSSAMALRHTRGAGYTILEDSTAVRADLWLKDLDATGIVRGGSVNTSYCYITADGTNSIHAFDNGDYIGYTRSTNTFSFVIGSAPQVYLADGSFYPAADSDVNFGGSSNRWNVVYSTNGVVTTSDKRRKDHVGVITDPGAVIDALQPVRFKWKSTGIPDVGFYAQDVAPLIPESVEVGDDKVDWGFKPDRLIPFLVAEIQSLRARVAALESR